MKTSETWRWYYLGLCSVLNAVSWRETHLLTGLMVDLEQSARAIPLLQDQAILAVGRRELRFILEASVKITFIEQKDPAANVTTKLTAFAGVLEVSSFKRKRDLSLSLFDQMQQGPFLADLDVQYRDACKSVHLSKEQIRSRQKYQWNLSEESHDTAAVARFEGLVAQSLGSSLALLFHSVSEQEGKAALAAFREMTESPVLGRSGAIRPEWLT
jgi:hypothetical protein